MTQDKKVYEVLEGINVEYDVHEHPPVLTVDDALEYWKDIEGVHCKNLFFRNQKGKMHYLVVMGHDKPLDISDLGKKTGAGKLSFASDKRLDKYLGLKTGAVSPFGIINDENKEVRVYIDEDIMKGEKVNFHPNVNTATISISSDDFRKFLGQSGNQVKYISI
ncbi:prolyl-tRNA synthetase associated domain-containing protein [Anaeromicrobium sediminis]|uniref:Proline--tRNA ligase n=1 Tax=Anaeromicrobium sediminis TaxID=1478221 RepID=A0A267MDU5_9FIRM|nr:prolyl-tRNA synthetase associated domain-containing protein [Anaeromicrobium sediminis]PAB57729.1 proline--tRNA ligase [Anaeromicrobium sediminis]